MEHASGSLSIASSAVGAGNGATAGGGGAGTASNNGSSVSSFDALVQNALAAGVPPQQVLQFLQNNLQNSQGASPLPTGSGTSYSQTQSQLGTQSQLNPTNSSHSATTANPFHGLSAIQQQLVAQHQLQHLHHQQQQNQAQQPAGMSAALTPQPSQQQQQLSAVVQQQQLQQHQHLVAAAAAAAAAQQNQTLAVAAAQQQMQLQQQLAAVVAAASGSQQQQQHSSSAQLSQFNTFNVPYIDLTTFQKVNMDVPLSQMQNGSDLPTTDINTLRFFFNFGIQTARTIIARQQQAGGNVGGNSTGQQQSGNNSSISVQQQQQLAMFQAQNAALLAASAQQQQHNNNSNASNQHQNDQQQQQQLFMQQSLQRVANEFNHLNASAQSGSNTIATSAASSAISAAGIQKTGMSTNPNSNDSRHSNPMSFSALQNSIVQQMAKITGQSPQTQQHQQAHQQAIAAAAATAFKPFGGVGNFFGNNPNSSSDLEALWLNNLLSSSGTTAQQLRSHPQFSQLSATLFNNAATSSANSNSQQFLTPQQQTAAAVQQLLLQQQQQLASSTNQTDNAELIRPQAINPLTATSAAQLAYNANNNVANQTATANSPLPRNHSRCQTIISSTTPSTTISVTVTNPQTTIANSNGTASPKPPTVPLDPAPRKSSVISGINSTMTSSPSALQTLNDIKQRGLHALRSHEIDTNESLQLQRTLAAMAATAFRVTGIGSGDFGNANTSTTTTIPTSSTSLAVSPGRIVAANEQNTNNNSGTPHSTTPNTTVFKTNQVHQSRPTSNSLLTNSAHFHPGMPSLAAQLSALVSTSSLMGNAIQNHQNSTTTSCSNFVIPQSHGDSNQKSLTTGTSGNQSHSNSCRASPATNPHSVAEQKQNLMNSLIHHGLLNPQQAQTAFLQKQLESENETALLSATELHYTETFKRTQGLTPAQLSAFYQNNQKNNISPRPQSGNNAAALSTTLSDGQRRKSGVYMLSMDDEAQKKRSPHPNTTVSQATGEKNHSIDYSSRPIDPIFRQAREHLENTRSSVSGEAATTSLHNNNNSGDTEATSLYNALVNANSMIPTVINGAGIRTSGTDASQFNRISAGISERLKNISSVAAAASPSNTPNVSTGWSGGFATPMSTKGSMTPRSASTILSTSTTSSDNSEGIKTGQKRHFNEGQSAMALEPQQQQQEIKPEKIEEEGKEDEQNDVDVISDEMPKPTKAEDSEEVKVEEQTTNIPEENDDDHVLMISEDQTDDDEPSAKQPNKTFQNHLGFDIESSPEKRLRIASESSNEEGEIE